MSVSQFSPILRQKIIEVYSDSSNKIDLASFGKLTRKQLFKTAPDTKNIRSKFEAKDFHSSSITLEGITALTRRIVETIDEDGTKQIIENFFNDSNFFYNFITYLESVPGSNIIEPNTGDYRLENIPQNNLKNWFISFIQQNLPNVPSSVISNIRKNIQSGHLAGVFFLKLKVALGVKADFRSGTEETYRDFTVNMEGVTDPAALDYLDTILKAVLDADYLTSNLITQQQVFIDATKSVLGDNPSLITELQFTADNEAAGDLLQQTGNQLNKLIQAASKGEMGATENAISTLAKTLQPVVDTILLKAKELRKPLEEQGLYDQIVKNAEKLANTFINAPGSVTLVQGIEDNIANVIRTGESLAPSTTKIRPTPIKQKFKQVVDISQVAKEFKKAAQAVKKSVKQTAIPNRVTVRAKKGTMAVDLTNLTNLFNSKLAEAIRQNMGTGDRRDILNLRSGRFAETVRVERVSQGRQGMITAYYNYMRYPYATFSTGGRQEFPRSRDPKLLISKSIREIAQQVAITRMRAVLV
jgi:hypothetical protein